MYDATHFLHIVGALGPAAAFGVEAAGLVGLRRATGADEALLWLRSRRWVLLIGPASIPMARVTPAVERASGPLPEELRRGLRSPLLTVSPMTRIAITVGIVLLMVRKPALPPSVLTIVPAVGSGGAAGLVPGTREPSPRVTGSAVAPTDAKR